LVLHHSWGCFIVDRSVNEDFLMLKTWRCVFVWKRLIFCWAWALGVLLVNRLFRLFFCLFFRLFQIFWLLGRLKLCFVRVTLMSHRNERIWMSSFLRLQKWLDRLILDFNFFDFLEHVDVDTLVILLGPCTRLHLIFGRSDVAILFSLLAGLCQYGGVILIIDRWFLLNVSCRPDRGDCLDAVQRRLIRQVHWAGRFRLSFLVFHFMNLNERRVALLLRSNWFFLYHLIVLSIVTSRRKLRTYDFYRRIQILLSSCSVVIFHPIVISGY